MYSRVSVTWNPLNELNRNSLAPDFKKNTENRKILKDKLSEFHYKSAQWLYTFTCQNGQLYIVKN